MLSTGRKGSKALLETETDNGGPLEYRISVLILVNEQALSPGRGYHKQEKEGVCPVWHSGDKGQIHSFQSP